MINAQWITLQIITRVNEVRKIEQKVSLKLDFYLQQATLKHSHCISAPKLYEQNFKCIFGKRTGAEKKCIFTSVQNPQNKCSL